jgi:hypothetical protein
MPHKMEKILPVKAEKKWARPVPRKNKIMHQVDIFDGICILHAPESGILAGRITSLHKITPARRLGCESCINLNGTINKCLR